MQALLSLSIALLSGLLLSRLAKLLKLPAVTAYLVAGILVGPYCLGQLGGLLQNATGIAGLGFVSEHDIEAVGILADVALGFIAFSIGNEFRLTQLKKIGKQATIVGIFKRYLPPSSWMQRLFCCILLCPINFPYPPRLF